MMAAIKSPEGSVYLSKLKEDGLLMRFLDELYLKASESCGEGEIQSMIQTDSKILNLKQIALRTNKKLTKYASVKAYISNIHSGVIKVTPEDMDQGVTVQLPFLSAMNFPYIVPCSPLELNFDITKPEKIISKQFGLSFISQEMIDSKDFSMFYCS